MARIKGKHFYTNYRNGIIALAPERVYLDLKKSLAISLKLSADERYDDGYGKAIEQGLSHFERAPVFTFVHSVEPKEMDVAPWFTGDSLLSDRLARHIENEGGTIVSRASHDLWVPITWETMAIHAWESRSLMRRRCREMATEAQFEEEFGVTTTELMRGKRQEALREREENVRREKEIVRELTNPPRKN